MAGILWPIETSYGTCRFRSRLEGRWATFFDTIGIAWEYEKQTFNLGDGVWYLPDFWLPNTIFGPNGKPGVWVEVKPLNPNANEVDKCCRLAEHTKAPSVIVTGPPEPRMEVLNEGAYAFSLSRLPCGDVGVSPDNRVAFVQCVATASCGTISIQPLEWDAAICPLCGQVAHDATSVLRAAYNAAYHAKFLDTKRASRAGHQLLQRIGLDRLGSVVQSLVRK